MNQINWKKVGIILGILTVLIIIGFSVWYYLMLKKTSVHKEKSKLTERVTTEDLKKIYVPEPGVGDNGNIGVPKEAIMLGPENKSKLRIFEIKGENGSVFPSMFRAYQDDIINIKLVAVDQDYDLRLEGYNIEIKSKKGETKTIEFQAVNTGIFNFYCSLCKTNKVGNVIVVPK